jgi:hypothetical protein
MTPILSKTEDNIVELWVNRYFMKTTHMERQSVLRECLSLTTLKLNVEILQSIIKELEITKEGL